MSSGSTRIGGLALHPLVMRAVISFCSRSTSLTRRPFSPTTSTGLSPVL